MTSASPAQKLASMMKEDSVKNSKVSSRTRKSTRTSSIKSEKNSKSEQKIIPKASNNKRLRSCKIETSISGEIDTKCQSGAKGEMLADLINNNCDEKSSPSLSTKCFKPRKKVAGHVERDSLPEENDQARSTKKRKMKKADIGDQVDLLMVEKPSSRKRRCVMQSTNYNEGQGSEVDSGSDSDFVPTSDVQESSKKRPKTSTRKQKSKPLVVNESVDMHQKSSHDKKQKGKAKAKPSPRKAETMPKPNKRKQAHKQQKTTDSSGDGPSTSGLSSTGLTSAVATEGDDSSSDDSSDWEEVAELPSELLEKKDVQITLDAPAAKKKKRFDWAAYTRMLWRRYQKNKHESAHKVELMCLFVHGLKVNGVCNHQLMKAMAISLYGKTTLKGKQCTSANIASVLSKLKEKVTVEPQPVFQTSINTLTLLDTLSEGLKEGVMHRSDEFILLMIAILRALGASTRLCMGWYPVPFRITHYQKLQSSLKAISSQNSSSTSLNEKSKTGKKSGGGKSCCPFTSDPPAHPDKQIWLEVYVGQEQKWVTVDSTGQVIEDLDIIAENLRKPVTYIVSYDNGGKLKDLTSKYDPKWMTGTKKLRVGDEWWEETILPYKAKESKKTKQEDDQLQTQLEKMPFPNTIGGFKDHPLYVLERHLLKFEAIYPRTALPLGYTKSKEVIYSRSCVHTLHSRETWLKEARQIKLGEEPYKMVKPRPKMKDIKNGVKITEATLPVFGRWQTENFVPPVAENGKVPRNAFGNVELFQPQMIPKGCVHLPYQAIGKLARKLDIDCAQAMIGWEAHSGHSCPQFDGWVVCKQYERKLLAALDEHERQEEEKAQAKAEKRIYGNWKKLIKGLLIRERLRLRYGKDTF